MSRQQSKDDIDNFGFDLLMKKKDTTKAITDANGRFGEYDFEDADWKKAMDNPDLFIAG